MKKTVRNMAVMALIASIIVIVVGAPTIIRYFVPAERSSPEEVGGIYLLERMPEDQEDFIGGEYFLLLPQGLVQLRPDLAAPRCAPEFWCHEEEGRWSLEGNRITLTVASTSIGGKVEMGTIIFEDDPCGSRHERPPVIDCQFIRRLGGNTYSRIDPNCVTLEQARVFAYDVNFKVPSWLPEGYEFKCASHRGFEIYLAFAPTEVNVTVGNLDRENSLNGAIIIYAVDEAELMGEVEYQAARGSRNRTQEVEIRASDVLVRDGTITYTIDSYLPKDVLVRVAESILEVPSLEEEQKPGSEDLPILPRPYLPEELMGEKISLQEAEQWARISGYRLEIPESLPTDYALKEIRVIAISDVPLRAGRIMLYFVPQDHDGEITNRIFWEIGGLGLEVTRSLPNFEETVRRALGREGDNVVIISAEIRVNGNFGYSYPGSSGDIPGPTRVLVWVDGDTKFRLVGNNENFSFEDMLRIAESI